MINRRRIRQIQYFTVALTLLLACPMAASEPKTIEFSRHVLPILSKLGCNSGACHGALAGKGGLKLSLHAYNPKGDHFAITRESGGRRIELSDPGRSLLLSKPTGALPHKGGLKLDPESADYQLLADWIASGAPGPEASSVNLSKIEVEPKTLLLKPDENSTTKSHRTLFQWRCRRCDTLGQIQHRPICPC